ncbi:hydrolase 1, exosortase A system-associated [Bowmanella denitrificans]|uniref:Hydrolase 1, exosortase A system-associated n=1 Tax=Bowmanella denitrificans TaxID=366582 RepID=A0ABP3HGT9_9ALTE
MQESAVVFPVGQTELIGVLNKPMALKSVAVLIIVGGPQYRGGSHRQFVQLARALGDAGICSLRFDYSGMGDSFGHKKAFDSINEDIAAACDCLRQKSGVDQVVIWGLCDAASAALMYASTDPSVVGMVLLNPWLRTGTTTGKTMLKYYYVQRVLSKDFWRKLVMGKVKLTKSINEAKQFAQDSLKNTEQSETDYQHRMLVGAKKYNGKVCLIISGKDLTAQEFMQQANSDKEWKRFVTAKCQVHKLAEADHTFSSAQSKKQVEQLTVDFINLVALQRQCSPM